MATFSKKSHEKLSTCVPSLQLLAEEAIDITDFSVICGHRTKEEQERAREEGQSKLSWPLSKHNRWPSRAIDVAPWPLDWEDSEGFCYLAGIFMALARVHKISLRWGGAWNGSLNEPGQLDDLGHFELLD